MAEILRKVRTRDQDSVKLPCTNFEALSSNLISVLRDSQNFSHFCQFLEKMAEILRTLLRCAKDLVNSFYTNFETLNSNLILVLCDSQNFSHFC